MSSTIQQVNPAAEAAPAGDVTNPVSGAPKTGSAETTPGQSAVQAQTGGWWRSVSPNAVIGTVGTLFAAAITLVVALLVVQLTAINNSIANLDTKIDNGIADLRAEMQAGFREIHVILLDHTDRLARLEAHAGLTTAAPPDS